MPFFFKYRVIRHVKIVNLYIHVHHIVGNAQNWQTQSLNMYILSITYNKSNHENSTTQIHKL